MKTNWKLGDTQPSRAAETVEDTSRSDLERLIHLSHTAGDHHAAMEYVQRAVDLSPDDPHVQESLQFHMFEILESDAFLAFLAETDKHYMVTFRNSRPFAVPKGHKLREAFPPSRYSEGRRAMGMIWWMLLGLIPAGLGAVILTPITVRRAMKVLDHNHRNMQERRMAWIALILAAGLGLLGLFLTGLLVIHLLL